MMEFYAQELWIFLIYNIRGSLLSCLLLRLTGPRPHTHSLCPPHPCPPALPAQGAPSGGCWALGLCVDRNDPMAFALVSELTVASLGHWLPVLSNLGSCASLRPATSCAQALLFAVISPHLSFGSHRSKAQLPFWGECGGWGCVRELPSRKR